MRRWRARNPERAKAIADACRQRNRLQIAASMKIYRQKTRRSCTNKRKLTWRATGKSSDSGGAQITNGTGRVISPVLTSVGGKRTSNAVPFTQSDIEKTRRSFSRGTGTGRSVIERSSLRGGGLT